MLDGSLPMCSIRFLHESAVMGWAGGGTWAAAAGLSSAGGSLWDAGQPQAGRLEGRGGQEGEGGPSAPPAVPSLPASLPSLTCRSRPGRGRRRR